ncbi:SDR family NAD(P)-dependent oxidoreductase [Actinomadura bangladeshensis]|uniref:SDR family NAD(P)-dependent oxidoreductase n=1 Tax=Actinomadura bangladeshensis TaxID=453573 RepID=A0A4R4PB30_9ACTN|nr:SDR family NAD(P)-dependent oxidoreductase [Actinomadura bangladeshensis]TDC19289.1 SDR family NAD(P)-dependent oxidoreductase [Actinomadura bangladeshensis]
MAGRVEGKVAFITGAGIGQGRSHAVRLASEGADIIAVDICAPRSSTLPVPFGQLEELEETQEALNGAVRRGRAELGDIDIVLANAGVMSLGGPLWQMDDTVW